MPELNLSDFSEDELTDLIENATHRRDELRDSRARGAGIGRYGSRGQDVRDPDHGAIPTPTPNDVEAVGPDHGVDDVAAKPRA